MRAPAALVVLALSAAPLPRAGAQAVGKCMLCHGKPRFQRIDPSGQVRVLFVDEVVLSHSVHAKKSCTDCHFDVKVLPHRERPGRVQCARCHYKDNPEGAPRSDKYLEYQESVHGRAAARGNPKAPLCQDCHGNHDVRPTRDALARVARLQVPETCGRCHLSIYAQYAASVHGRAALTEKKAEAPVCTDCHGEHAILAPENPKSSVSPTNVARTCSHCHAAETIVGKYGIEVEQVATYQNSFHGIAGQYGSKTVANCSSCHGVHDILPPEDPRSSVNLRNIPHTCGKCHPGANINYARGKIHVNPESRGAGVVFYVAQAFKWLTLLTMLGLLAHIAVDLYRRTQNRRAAGGGKASS